MFFRHGTDTGKRAATRSGGTNEAQLKELRNKARRRLIGALALVLAAFIVVPWLFDEPVSDDAHPPVVVPATPSGLPPAPPAPAPASTEGQPASGTVAAADTPAPGATASGTADAAPAAPAPDGSQPPAGASTPAAAPASPAPQPAAAPDTAPAEPPKPAQDDRPAAEPSKPAKPAAKPVERTDDGSVALALLAGKSPAKAQGGAAAPAPASAAQGRYYLQVAAYTTEQDAQQRRDSLRQAGVTDAYVERGQSGGRTVYRLRVGPFGSHEAAQAAQARLRALGYQNGLISDK